MPPTSTIPDACNLTPGVCALRITVTDHGDRELASVAVRVAVAGSMNPTSRAPTMVAIELVDDAGGALLTRLTVRRDVAIAIGRALVAAGEQARTIDAGRSTPAGGA